MRNPIARAMRRTLRTGKRSTMTDAEHAKLMDQIADKVLSYRAPARTTKAKKRQRLRRKTQRESSI